MRVLLVLTTLALVLAGCSGGKPADDEGAVAGTEGAQPARIEVDPKSDRGAVSGIVVDEAIVPLDGVEVSLHAGDVTRNATTKAGSFAFEELDPGAYFLTATIAGYEGPATSVDVAAGEVSYTRLLLKRVPGIEGYHYTVEKAGFIQASPAAGGAIADAAIDAFSFIVGDNPLCKNCIFTIETGSQDAKTFVVEGTWDNTIPPATAEDLTLFIINSNFTTEKPGYGSAITSPYLDHIASSDAVFNQGENSKWWRFQISGSLTQPNVNQQFHLFVTVFVNQPAPEGWSLAAGDL